MIICYLWFSRSSYHYDYQFSLVVYYTTFMSIVLLVFQMLSLLFQVNKYQVIVHFSRRLLLLISLLTLQSPVL